MKKIVSAFFCTALLLSTSALFAQAAKKEVEIKVPKGFKITTIAEGLGKARHITVAPSGDVYVKLDRLKEGNGILKLSDANGDGKIDATTGFGNFTGTGIAIKNGYLYASSNTSIFRYKLDDKGEVIDKTSPEVVVKDLVDKGEHNSKSITLDNSGNIYVNIGAYSNACQVQNRTKGSPGQDPCPILEHAGGIWQFKADGKDQSYAQGVRYATGIRNSVGLDWNSSTNTLFIMQHGRDQFANLFPEMFSDSMSAELPAEEMLEAKSAGADFGWPYCYYNQFVGKKLLNPEYGGDGKTVGRCDGVTPPVAAFPGHMAPNGLLFYTGNQFPEKYKDGAFIAFHGSWNRSPLAQKGFFVAFLPFKDGKPNGEYEVFASGFAGSETISSPGQAMYRPCGLAQGPDGSLYVTDDAKGTIFKVTYKENKEK